MEEERRLTWNTILSTLFYINLSYVFILSCFNTISSNSDRLYFTLLITFHCFILRWCKNYTNEVFDKNKSLDEFDKKDIFSQLIIIIILSVIFITIEFNIFVDIFNIKK